MTGMEHTIEQVARVLAEHRLGEPGGGTANRAWCECSCGSRLETVGGTRDRAMTLGRRHIARALHASGLLALAPLREEWSIGKHEDNLIERWGRERIRSLEDAEYLVEVREMSEQVFRRYCTGWGPADAVDRAEGDGRAEP